MGEDAAWEEATDTLREVAIASGLDLVPDPGGAAFYGPKISVQARDAIGRTWQMSTIQLDFNLPERFGLEYTAPDGTRQRPVMIHRALFGSIERFIGVLTEHYAGAFPVWLSPVQVVGIPVAEQYGPYLDEVIAKLKAAGVRAEVDHSSDRMPKKIRNATKSKVPYQLIAGEDDRAAGAVSFRFRDGRQENGIPVAEAIERITLGDRLQSAGVSVAQLRTERIRRRRRRRRSRRSAISPAVPDAFQRLWTPHRMVYIEDGQQPAAARLPVLRRADAAGREGAHRRPRHVLLRAAQPVPVQLGPPAGVPVPPHRPLRPGERGRGRRDGQPHANRDARAAHAWRTATDSISG